MKLTEVQVAKNIELLRSIVGMVGSSALDALAFHIDTTEAENAELRKRLEAINGPDQPGEIEEEKEPSDG